MSALLTVVTGPPCSGKSTWVEQHRGPESVVLDLDRLAEALGYPADHISWDDRHPAAELARGVRYLLVRQLLAGEVAAEAWVIDSSPAAHMRSAYDRAGAEWVDLDPGLAVCLERAAHRSAETADHVRRWYASRQPEPPVDNALGVFG